MERKRKQSSFTLDFKIQLIDEVERGASRTTLCKQFGIAKSTLATILQHRDKIRSAVRSTQFSPHRKRMRRATHEDLETALLQWYKQAPVHVTGNELAAKAEELVKEMGLTFTVCSSELQHDTIMTWKQFGSYLMTSFIRKGIFIFCG